MVKTIAGWVVGVSLLWPGALPARGEGIGGGAAVRSPANTASKLAEATKKCPFVNSLGMPFVPIEGTQALFCIWETRVRDFEVFVKEGGYKWDEKPGFKQTPEHPVVNISWDDAKAFCAWLSKKEARQYRLPTEKEWDAAAGSSEYPWGDSWPPPREAENIGGEESMRGKSDDPKDVVKGYKDDHPRTAPVSSYKANPAGLYDMGGNVQEWCEDRSQARQKERVVRGGSWALSARQYCRQYDPGTRSDKRGFRCVLVVSSP